MPVLGHVPAILRDLGTRRGGDRLVGHGPGLERRLPPARPGRIGTREFFEFGRERFEFLAAGHHVEQRFALGLALGVDTERAAAVEDGELVADRPGVMDVVGGEHHAEMRRTRMGHVAEHHRSLLDAQGRLGSSRIGTSAPK